MAKTSSILVKMESTAGTGVFYIRKKNPHNFSHKLEMRKYDSRVRKHVMFKEKKIK